MEKKYFPPTSENDISLAHQWFDKSCFVKRLNWTGKQSSFFPVLLKRVFHLFFLFLSACLPTYFDLLMDSINKESFHQNYLSNSQKFFYKKRGGVPIWEDWVQPAFDNITGKAGTSYDNVFFKGFSLLVACWMLSPFKRVICVTRILL
jgi:hypothetical protein